MSIQKIHLRKLLRLMYSTDKKRKVLLREDIRKDMNKQEGADSGGGDFYVPFWPDAKLHAAGKFDLKDRTKFRISQNAGRNRLYPLLRDGFLKWWNEKRRWINEHFELLLDPVKEQFPVPSLESIVKVDNILAVRIGGQSDRVIYPYFFEDPVLEPEAARIGLWLLASALKDVSLEDVRILDILRSASYSIKDFPLQGNEEKLFLEKYKAILLEWKALKAS